MGNTGIPPIASGPNAPAVSQPAGNQRASLCAKTADPYIPLISPPPVAPFVSPADAEGYHFCLLENNWQNQEEMRQESFKKESGQTGSILNIAEQKPRGITARAKAYLFGAAIDANHQVKNSVLLDAAGKAVRIYEIFNRRQEEGYLAQAEKYLRAALANKDTASGTDIWRNPFSREILQPAIDPVEEYFKLKLTLFQVLSLSKRPLELERLGKEIEKELADTRLVKAQRETPESARGYLNRLYILYGYAGLYDPDMDKAKALDYANQAYAWARQEHGRNTGKIEYRGMNKKDLRYDVLISRIIAGRLLVKLGRYDEATKIFQESLAEPEATKKSGGFLDIGVQSFYGLINIAITTSSSTEEAAQKMEKIIDWNKLSSDGLADLREALGLIIRAKKIRDWASETLQAPIPDLDLRGTLALRLDRPWLAAKDTTPSESKITLAGKTPAAKLELFMQLLDYVEIPFDQKEELFKPYRLLKRAK
jgi:tetratricopeptide (TPR) repeat protein